MLCTLNASAVREGAALPANVREVDISWGDLSKLLAQRFMSTSTRASRFNVAPPIKTNELNPLISLLFPELVDPYLWWGYLGWDTWLGDLRAFASFLSHPSTKTSFWSPFFATPQGPPNLVAFGPFSVVRNVPALGGSGKGSGATIWSHDDGRAAVELMLSLPGYSSLEEWGQHGYAFRPRVEPRAVGFNASFSGLLLAASKRGEVRLVWGEYARAHLGGFMIGDWPHVCANMSHCGYCCMEEEPPPSGRAKPRLRLSGHDGKELLFCHFPLAKHMHESTPTDRHQAFVDSTALASDWGRGVLFRTATRKCPRAVYDVATGYKRVK